MSGGVDSAVSLLRAGPDAVGVTLRLWLDPAGPNAERACCSPEAVVSPRGTWHRLGLPHDPPHLLQVVLRNVVQTFVPGHAQDLNPNSCMRCNGVFSFDAVVP